MDKESIFKQLKWSLQAMACSGEDQIQLFPDFVVVSDEIINDFDHWRQVAVGNHKSDFTMGQLESLTNIDRAIDNISNSKEEIWDNESLKIHQLWDNLRDLGLKALKEFKWNNDAPPTNRSTYVRG